MPALHLASTAEANDYLAADPMALLIGMVLDQQIPMEKAFTSPAVLRDRVGRDLSAADIASYDPETFVALFREPPALHRFPASMATRVQELGRVLVERYNGDPTSVWRDAVTGDELVRRVGELPGFGDQKARIFAALLGKQLRVRPPGWREASEPYGAQGTFLSVADAVDDASIAKVRAYKQQQKAAAKETAATRGRP